MKVSNISRARAEKSLSTGKVDPTLLLSHPNYHVRAKAWWVLTLGGSSLRDRFAEHQERNRMYSVVSQPTQEAVS